MPAPMASSKARQLHGRGHAWLLFFGILICQPLTQAFCGARQAVRHPAVRLQAEAKQGSKSPVKELEEKLSKALGRKIKKGDMVWTYQASVELPCLSDFSSSLVGGRVTFDAANADECKRKAASAVLEALDFEKLAEEAGAAGAAAAGAAPKEAKKPKKDGGVLKDLEIGQQLNTKVVRKTRNGLRLDWKGKEVTLPASEVSDTFPVNVPQNGQKVKVRVLSKEKGTVVTMREGSLERPEKENVQVDLSALEGLDRATKLEAEVLGFTWQDAAVKVVGADGKVTLAQLPRKQFTEGAEKELAIGSKIQVRKKYLTKDRALVSMKDPPSRKIEDLVPGEELSGTVESLLFSNNYEKPAAFLDVGFDRPAYLDWQEASDTYPGKAFRRLKVGKPVTGRVLRVQDDRIYVTCRSGDLYRPTFSEAPPQALQEIVDKFSNLPKDEYLDARVLRLFPRHAVVTVKMPDGTEAEGYIPASYYTRSFEESGAPNDQIKVRLLPEQPKARGRRSRVMLTLKDGKKDAEEKQDASEATVKEEVAEAAKEPETAPPEPEKTEPPKEDDGPLKGLSDFLMR